MVIMVIFGMYIGIDKKNKTSLKCLQNIFKCRYAQEDQEYFRTPQRSYGQKNMADRPG